MGGALRIHSAGYRTVLLSGQTAHWTAPATAATAPELWPCSFRYHPGGQADADDCRSEQCPLFLRWDGRRDAQLAP